MVTASALTLTVPVGARAEEGERERQRGEQQRGREHPAVAHAVAHLLAGDDRASGAHGASSRSQEMRRRVVERRADDLDVLVPQRGSVAQQPRLRLRRRRVPARRRRPATSRPPGIAVRSPPRAATAAGAGARGRAARRRSVGDAAVGHLAAAVHHHDAVDLPLQLGQRVRRQQHHGAVVAQIADDFVEALAQRRIEPGRRLVQQQRARACRAAPAPGRGAGACPWNRCRRGGAPPPARPTRSSSAAIRRVPADASAAHRTRASRARSSTGGSATFSGR